MSAVNLEDLTKQLSKTAVTEEPSGVSFKGRGLKLNNADDCKEVVNAIKACKNLTYLDLEGNTLGVDAAKEIADALKDKKELKRALWKDLFTGRMKTEIPKALTFLGEGLKAAGAKLDELDLSDNAFGPIGIEALAAFLSSPVCYQLKELKLNNNGMGITGGKMLAQALLNCHRNSSAAGNPLSLKVFIAGRNRLENEGATALSQVFQTLGSLEEIQMPQNGIYHKGILKISEALAINPNLRVLNLNDNTLTVKGAESIALALPHLQKLQTINLGDCLLKNKGAIVIAEALSQEHEDLEDVQLSGNEIRSVGGIAVAQALKTKTKLKRLCLSDNEFGNEGRKALKDELISMNKGDTLECPSDDDRDVSGSEEEESDGNTDDEGSEGESEEDESCPTSPEKTPIAPPRIVAKADLITIDDPSPVGRFLANRTDETLSNLNRMGVMAIQSHFKKSPTELDIEGFIGLIMKVSDMSMDTNEATKKLSRTLAVSLYQSLFNWADKQEKSSIANNVLFVYLGLIKDEDKKFKITWNADRCISVLQTAIVEKIVPNFTQHILTCCLDRKFKKKHNSEEIVVL